MKRAREENAAGPHLKRPATYRGEMSGPAHANAGAQRLTTDDALAYLKAVKDMFQDKKGKYDEFLEVMKDFKAQRINTAGVITRVKELFKGHPDLILGFNTFLPKGYEITLPPEEEWPKKQPVEFNQAISYVNKIKTRFQHDEQVYKAFLEILNMYRKGNKSISEVYQEVAALFREHQDLLEEFTYFLPDSSGVVHPLPKFSGNFVPRRDDKMSGVTVPRQSHLEKLPKREKMAFAVPSHDRGSEKHTDREHHDRVFKAEKEQRKKLEKEKEKKEDRDLKDSKEERDSDQDQEKDPDGMQRLPNKRKSARRADELIRKQAQVGEGGEALAGPPAPLSMVEEKKVPKILQKKLAFFEKVKSRLRSQDTYQEFLKCLNLYSEEIISRAQLHSLVDDLLGKFPDLVEGFSDFLAHCESNEGYLANVVSKKLGDGPLLKPKIEKEREKDKDRERDKEREREKDGEPREKEREKDKGFSHAPREALNPKMSLLPNKEKYMTKPISELDLSNCERCTPSYRLLPKNYPKPVVSHRTKLAHSVLNDVWVSVTSGSEDYSFKHMRKNQYEESLFRCEDDRFELDMLVESTAITAKRMEELVEKMQEANGKQDAQILVDDYLTAINFRCIERLYGDHGLDVIELLRKNSAVSLPVIASRLKQKQEEWSKCRSDMNKVWAEVYSKNYHKSLDHRSFYFKQQDKKSLSTKALLAEIKEISDRKRKDDDVILSIAAGNRRPLICDLKFEYPDTSIYDDLYRIIKYSADEVCTTMEQSDKIMRFWTTFIEPFFGVPSRPHGAEDTEEVAKVKSFDVKESGLSNGESDGSVANGGNLEKKQQTTAVETKNGASPVDDPTTASSQVGLGRIDRSGSGVAVSANEEATLLSHATDKKLDACELGMQKSNTAHVVALEMHYVPKHDSGEKRGDLKHTGPDIGASTSRSNLNTSREFSTIEHIDRKASTSRKDKKPGLKAEHSMSKCRDLGADVAATLGALEREEGELSPSPDVEERQTENYASGEILVPVTGNNAGGQVLENGAPNHVVGARPDEEEDGECDGEAEGEHDADADDEGGESAQKSSDESENASEPVEEVSGSESGDGDDFIEDHEGDEDEDDDEEHEVKNESEGEAEGLPDVQDNEGDGVSLPAWDRSLLSCLPLAAHGPSIALNSASDQDTRIFYGNDALYILFRLHQTLYDRILSAKVNAKAAEQKWNSSKDTSSPDLYEKFMRLLFNLLHGSADNAKFEDDCRAIIGTQSYVLFTLDKLIFKLVKQLQAVATDEMANKLLSLYNYENSRPPGSLIDVVYHANACVILHDENIYRFDHSSSSCQLSIQLMEGGPEKLEVAANAMESKFAKYLNQFLQPASNLKERCPVYLSRNKRYYGEDDEHATMQRTMKNVCVANGLEYKISCSTSKVSYVLDTEDLLYRRKRKREESDDTRRVQKFHRWIDTVASRKQDR